MFFNFNYKIYSGEDCCISPASTAFRAGFGLIETMFFQHGKLRFGDRHYKRLALGAEKLGIDLKKLTAAQLQDIIRELISLNQIKDSCVIRLQVFPDSDGASAAFIAECSLPQWLHEKTRPKTIGLAQDILKNYDALSSLKTTSRLLFEMAKKQALDKGWDDMLLLNPLGRVVESTISNVFWIKDGSLFTPPLTEGCVAGILRGVLLANPPDGFQIKEQPLTIENLKAAEEVFLTNAIRGIQPVSRFEDVFYQTGKGMYLKEMLAL